MTRPSRQHVPEPTIEWRRAGDYISRDHRFAEGWLDEPLARPRQSLLAQTAGLVRLWHRRHKTRQHLEGLDHRSLADVGIDPNARDREVAKKFWQP